MKRRSRANVLLTAIMVAIGLFLLSAALVVMNRQDLQVALFLDHRLHAGMAARSAASFALQAMRTNANWEDTVSGWNGTMGDNVDWSATVSHYPDPDGTDYLLQIDGTGHSGPLTEHYQMIVEEVRMVAKAPLQRLPMLFAYTTDGSLAVLQPTFQWAVLGPPPNYGSWLVAHEGPLFSFGPAKSGLGIPNLKKPDGSIVAAPDTTHEHLVTLQFNNHIAEWVDIPDPGPILGRVFDGTFVDDGRLRTGNAVSWYGLTGPALAADQGVVYAHAIHYFWRETPNPNNLKPPPGLFSAPALLSYDTSRGAWNVLVDELHPISAVSNPQIDTAPAPDTSSLGVVSGSIASITLEGDHTLSAGGGRWEVGSQPLPPTQGFYNYDGRMVTHLVRNGIMIADSEPNEELQNEEPDLMGEVWDPIDQVFKPKRFRDHRSSRVRLMASSKRPITIYDNTKFEGIRSLEDGGNPQVQFEGYKSINDGGNTAPSFQVEHPDNDVPLSAYTAADTASPDWNASFTPTYAPNEHPDGQIGIQNIKTVPSSLGGNQVATSGSDLVTFARVALNNYLPRSATPNRKMTVLIHYDGKHWQVWPAGVHALAVSRPEQDTSYPWIGNDFRIQTENLAWAEYADSTPMLRRYQPIAVYRGQR